MTVDNERASTVEGDEDDVQLERTFPPLPPEYRNRDSLIVTTRIPCSLPTKKRFSLKVE